MQIKTERLTLRPWQPKDSEPFAALNQDSAVAEFFPKILSKKESDELITKIKNEYAEHGFGLMAVELNSNHKFIGFIGLSIPSFQSNFTPCVEIGWRIAKKYWGQGLATEGAKAVLNYAFQELKLEEVVSFTAKNNIRSIRVMEKIGMKHDKNRDFLHPKLPNNHALAAHVLYCINKKSYKNQF